MYQVYNYRIEFDTMTFRSTERVWDIPKPDELPLGQLSVGILIDDSLHGNGGNTAGCFVKPPMFIVLHPAGDSSIDHPLIGFNEKILSASPSVTDRTRPFFVNFYKHGFALTSIGSDGLEVELIYVPERGIDDAFASHMCGPIDFSALSGDSSIQFTFTVVVDSTALFSNDIDKGGYYVLTDHASLNPNVLAGYPVTMAHPTDVGVNTICSVTAAGLLKPISGTVVVKQGDTPSLTIGSNFVFNGVSANSETDVAAVKRLIKAATAQFVVR